MIGKRRQMIYLPEINLNSFVFFFRKGDDGNSWSIRDYSVQNRASGPRYAQEFGFSLDDLWNKVVHHFDAPTHPSTDLNFWYRHTLELNRTYLGDRPGSITHIEPNLGAASRIAGERREAFPIIDRDRFERHPKSRKPQDRERMLFSKTSEDWVTWTAFGLLERDAPAKWWLDLVSIARASNPGLGLPA